MTNQTTVEEAMKIAQNISYADLVEKADISVEKLWLILAASIFKGMKVSETQYQESRKMFYCGFTECFRFMTDVAEDLPEEKAMTIFTKFMTEINQFHDENIHDILGAKKQ